MPQGVGPQGADSISLLFWCAIIGRSFAPKAWNYLFHFRTPEGVVNVHVGDEVVTEIDGIGRLVNTIVGDEAFGR